MRKIDDEIIEKIIYILPKELTEAIYIFGSYGTEYFDEDSSDLDIGWFTSEKIDLSIRSKYRSLLIDSLDIDIDLVPLTKDSNYNLLCNVFDGQCIYTTSTYNDWFDKFYDYCAFESQFIDVYMEEYFKYV